MRTDWAWRLNQYAWCRFGFVEWVGDLVEFKVIGLGAKCCTAALACKAVRVACGDGSNGGPGDRRGK